MAAKGRLIALEGSGSRSMSVAAIQLQRHLRANGARPGVSKWDASGVFFEMNQGPRDIEGASPRTLLLLYSADLFFRLRWEIRPALEEGLTVIAASYVSSAMAFGRACGLQQRWLAELFKFAPAADAIYRVPEDTIPANKRGSPTDSFLEFAFRHLRTSSGSWDTEEIRNNFLAHLKALESRGKCELVTPRLLAAASS
jgi:hypothetical protein